MTHFAVNSLPVKSKPDARLAVFIIIVEMARLIIVVKIASITAYRLVLIRLFFANPK